MFFFRRGENVGDKDWCLLEERFKNLASSGQILGLPSSSKAKASSSTLYYYMFGASGEVVNFAEVTHAQAVSRATSFTRGDFVDNL